MATPTEALKALLASHTPEDEKERADLAAMRNYATSLAEPFSRKEPEAHFTASALVVDADLKHVCLVHHAKLRRWLQPGGHVERGDEGDVAKGALREAREETGLDVHLADGAPRPFDVDVHRIPERKDEPDHWHLDVRFLVVATNPEALQIDANESLGARWLTFEEAADNADELPLRRMIRKAQRWAEQKSKRIA
jgi:8-oxo-dGTP pyrophosphatase MutT (NUDIX family)